MRRRVISRCFRRWGGRHGRARRGRSSRRCLSWYSALLSYRVRNERFLTLCIAWAGDHYDRLPALAVLIFGPSTGYGDRSVYPPCRGGGQGGNHHNFPIAFTTARDPVATGLVASLNRPGGNMTGATFMGTELSSKGLGLLRELVPNAKVIAVLVNPDNSMRNL